MVVQFSLSPRTLKIKCHIAPIILVMLNTLDAGYPSWCSCNFVVGYTDNRLAHLVACSKEVAEECRRLIAILETADNKSSSVSPSESSRAFSMSSGEGMKGLLSQYGISHIIGGSSLNLTVFVFLSARLFDWRTFVEQFELKETGLDGLLVYFGRLIWFSGAILSSCAASGDAALDDVWYLGAANVMILPMMCVCVVYALVDFTGLCASFCIAGCKVSEIAYGHRVPSFTSAGPYNQSDARGHSQWCR